MYAKDFGKARQPAAPARMIARITARQSLHQTSARLRSPAVAKQITIPVVLFLAIVFLISACVSRDEDVSERSGSQAAPVPGEKTHDEGAYAPGPPGSSGSVRW